MQKIKEGDRKSFESIFRMYYGDLCAYSNKITEDSDKSQEVVQEVFIKFWEKNQKINISHSIKAYLFRAVHNTALNSLKKRKNEERFPEGMEISEEPNFDFSIIDDNEILKEKIYQAIEELPVQCKKIFILNKIEELKYKEVAEKLDISVRTVETQVRRANMKLREILKDHAPLIIFFTIFLN